jgi:hypothetical protein
MVLLTTYCGGSWLTRFDDEMRAVAAFIVCSVEMDCLNVARDVSRRLCSFNEIAA